MSTLKVACAQFKLVDNDFDANMHHARNMALKIAEQEKNVDLILFCETCLEGVDKSFLEANLTAERIAQIEKFWSDLAAETGMHVLAGRVDRRGEKWYNLATCYAPDGTVLAEYGKTHLYNSERDFMTPGDKRVIFTLKDWRIGLMICADLGFPELSRAMAVDGVDMFAVPSCWGEPHAMLWTLCNQMRAAENGCWLVSCNRIGPELVRNLIGSSMVVSPSGEIMANLGLCDEAYFVHTLTHGCPSGTMQPVGWLDWLRPELYV